MFTSAIFVLFIAFLVLCVMNLLTGIFCEHAIEVAHRDTDNVIAEQLNDKDRYTRELNELFQRWDSSGDGDLTLAEFQEHLEDERMQAFFRSLEIEAADAWSLFKLLGADGQGTVDSDEFVTGCLRLRGGAKAIQIQELSGQVQLL